MPLNRNPRAAVAAAMLTTWVAGLPLCSAGPNLVANGLLNRNTKWAEMRPLLSRDGVFYAFDGDDHFGRVVVSGVNNMRPFRDKMRVGYVELGAQEKGGIRGLLVDTKEVDFPTPPGKVSVWFELKGELRPNRTYEYVIQAIVFGRDGGQGVRCRVIAPALWADGQPQGAGFNVVLDGVPRETTGRVRTGSFGQQTGTAAVVVELPEGAKEQFLFRRIVFREVDEALAAGQEPEMPVPIRYIPIEDSIERRVAEVLAKSSELLKQFQDKRGFYGLGEGGGGIGGGGIGGGGGQGSQDGVISDTAMIVSALAEMGEDTTEEPLSTALDWLADERRLPEEQPSTTAAVANRLYCLARHGDLNKHGRTIARDLDWLQRAQLADGGWAETSPVREPQAGTPSEPVRLQSDHVSSAGAVDALREAHFAGRSVDIRLWRAAAGYWVDAQVTNGGFTGLMPAYGGVGEVPTLARTAAGLSALLSTLDVAHGLLARNCTQFRANRRQLDAIGAAWNWLLGNYAFELDRDFVLPVEQRMAQEWGRGDDPFTRAFYLLGASRITGRDRLANQNLFRAEARNVLQYYDRASGVFAGSLRVTGSTLELLASVHAPTMLQRLIAGGDEFSAYKGDAEHVTRFVSRARRRSHNWREISIDRPMEELAKTPILYLSVEAMPDWSDEEWGRLRDYCFEGGVMVVNVSGEDAALSDAAQKRVAALFPEYTVREMAADDPLLALEGGVTLERPLRVIGNELKNFVFFTPSDWSCIWQMYQTREHPEVFAFMNALLTYATDGEPIPGAYDPSPYATGAEGGRTLRMAYLEVGGSIPAYPDFTESVNRLMQTHYRVNVEAATFTDGQPPPILMWVAVTGPAPWTADQKQAIRAALENDTYLFMDVAGGNQAWAESFEASLRTFDPDLTIKPLPSLHPVYTGQVRGTQGFDVKQVSVRKALHRKRYPDDEDKDAIRTGRCDLYRIMHRAREIGVLSRHDICSGVGNVRYPGVRGPVPEASRRLAMNVVLRSMERRLGDAGEGVAGKPRGAKPNWWVEQIDKAKKVLGPKG